MTLDEIRARWAALTYEQRAAAFDAMTLDELRAAYPSLNDEELRNALPSWFPVEPGPFDPSYPSWEDLYEESELESIGGDIADAMAEYENREMYPRLRRSNIDWPKMTAGIQGLIERGQIVYFPGYHDWLGRNAPEGSRWRPRLALNANYPEDASAFDRAAYTKLLDGPTAADALRVIGHPTWTSLHEADFQKTIGVGKDRRASKDVMSFNMGVFRERLIGTTPFLPVVGLVRQIWLDEFGQRAFRPEIPFSDDVAERKPTPDGKRENYYIQHWQGALVASVAREKLNPAGKFLSLVLKEVDHHCVERQSGLVASAFRRRGQKL